MKKILIFIVLLTATSLISGVAYSKAKGTISGRVTDESGNGIADVSVDVFDPYDIRTAGSSTNSNGYYSLSVPVGTYKVRFGPLPYSGYYAPEWYNNRSHFQVGDLVRVTAFRTTSNVNAKLQVGGSISGRVTSALGDNLANVYVDAFDLDYNWMGGSRTDGDGNYSFNVPAGTYEVRFGPLSSSGYYAPEWYDNKSHFEVADPLTVTAFQTTSNINAQLGMGGTISGRVTGTFRKGIMHVYVGAFDPNGNWMGGAFGGSSTDNDGRYSFNVPVGSYRVRFSPLPSSGYYAQEWYENKSHFEAGDLVPVTLLQTTPDINPQLEIGGAISGRVTDVSGISIPGVGVNAYDLNNNFIMGVQTNSEGFYAMVLAAGNYKVEFVPSHNSGNYVSKWYNSKTSFQPADTVKVIKRRTKSNINVELDPL